LGKDRKQVRSLAVAPDGRSLAVLVVDPAGRRTEIVRVGQTGVLGRFARFSERPGETDDTLGANCRVITTDADGNIWVTTNAWGQTSVFRRNQDGAPYEETVTGAKGAVKKFSSDGRFLGSVSLLSAPLDMVPATADGRPVMIASYRQVSAYHRAQVREVAMVIGVDDVKRLGAIKVPAGSLAIDDSGRVWAADVAGHVTCCTVSGRKLFDVTTSPAQAVPDAVLPSASPLPTVLRPAGGNGVWALSVLQRRLTRVAGEGESGPAQPIPAETGALTTLISGADNAGWVLGEKSLWASPAGP